MKGRVVFLLLVLLALFACAAEARHRRKLRSTKNRRTNFDFFFLVRQWPATFCNDHHCTHKPPKKYAFTLHGMWPQRRDGTWPEFCDPGSHLRMDDIDDLVDDMEHDWPSWSSTDEVFWDHEWSRHGTCAAPVTGGQHGFFKAVLSLHHKLNIQNALSAAGIRPSNSRRYPVQDIKDAIEDMYGVMPHVTCDGQGELSEVWMCINKKLKPIDCVEDPRPHNKNRRAAATAAAEGAAATGQEQDDYTSAPAPPNYNCNMVTIPKLRKGWGSQHAGRKAAKADELHGSHTDQHHHEDSRHAGRHHHDHDGTGGDDDDEEVDFDTDFETDIASLQDSVAEAAAAIDQLGVAAVASVVKATVDAAAEAVADSSAADIVAPLVTTSVASSLAAVEQAAAAVLADVTQAVTASAAAATAAATTAADTVADATAETAAAVAADNLQQQGRIEQQPQAVDASTVILHTAAVTSMPGVKSSQAAAAGPNQHLTLLAGVVVAVVSAAVVAAGVALRAQAGLAGDACCKARSGLYQPPPSTLPEGPDVSESRPLLGGV